MGDNMKEFIVNNRKLVHVDCSISLRHCPVYYKILLTKSASDELSWSQNCTYNPNIVLDIKVPDAANNIKTEIMNTCMECNVKVR